MKQAFSLFVSLLSIYIYPKLRGKETDLVDRATNSDKSTYAIFRIAALVLNLLLKLLEMKMVENARTLVVTIKRIPIYSRLNPSRRLIRSRNRFCE